MDRLLLIFCLIVLSGCNTALQISTPTVPINSTDNLLGTIAVSATPTYIPLYPPCITPRRELPPFPPLEGASFKQLDGLTVEEYRSYVYLVHIEDLGCEYGGRKFDERTIDLKNSFHIDFQPIDPDSELVKVLQYDVVVFEAKTLTYGSSGLLQAWSYDNHWVIEIKTAEGIDIIRDGQSLKNINKYDQVFAFQLLAGKPFYFFKRGNVWAVSYNNDEFQLDYDDISYTNVSIGMDPSIIQFQNMVIFEAKRGSDNYTVVIGAFR